MDDSSNPHIGREHPRIDRIAVDTRRGKVVVLRGTPYEGATLENLYGLAPLPANHVPLDQARGGRGPFVLVSGEVS